MSGNVEHFRNGVAQAFGRDLGDKILQTQQGQQALQLTANTIATSGAAVVGTVAAAGHVATATATALMTGGAVVAVALAPAAAVAATGYGIYRLCKWLGE